MELTSISDGVPPDKQLNISIALPKLFEDGKRKEESRQSDTLSLANVATLSVKERLQKLLSQPESQKKENVSSMPESPLSNKRKRGISTDKSNSSKKNSQMQKSSQKSQVESISGESNLQPYWNESVGRRYTQLSVAAEIDWLDLRSLSSKTFVNTMV